MKLERFKKYIHNYSLWVYKKKITSFKPNYTSTYNKNLCE